MDANVLLEVVLGRKKQQSVRKILAQNLNKLYISALTAHLVVHFGQKRATLPVLQNFLRDYLFGPLEATDFEWAFNNARNDDFEDALQLAVAIRHGCQEFLTLDKRLYRDYKNLPSIQFTLIR